MIKLKPHPILGSTLLLLVFLIPLMGPWGRLGYEESKVLWFLVGVTMVGAGWLIYLRKNGQKFKWTIITKAAGIFLAVLFITSWLGVLPLTSILGRGPYFQGWVLYAYLWFFSLIVGHLKIPIQSWALVLVVSAVVVSLLAVGDWVSINFLGELVPTYAGRVISTFGQPNFYAGFILLVLPFWNILKLPKFQRWGIGVVLILGILVSFSRAAILMMVGLVFLWLAERLGWVGKMVISLLLAAVIGVILSAQFSSGLLWEEWIRPLSDPNPKLTAYSLEKRVYIWPVVTDLIATRPFLGYGLENLAPTFFSYKPPESLRETTLFGIKDMFLDRTHNYQLDLLFFSGMLGLLSWWFLVWVLLKKTQSKLLATSLTIYLLWVQFQNQSVVHLIYFWLVAGLVDQENGS